MELELLHPFAVWAIDHPTLLLLAALAGAIGSAAVGALFGRNEGWSDRAEPASPSRAPAGVPTASGDRIPQDLPPLEDVVAAPPETVEVPPLADAVVAEPEPTPEPEAILEREPAPPPAGLRDRLRRTREALLGGLGQILGGGTVDEQLIERLEELLFQADLGVKTASSLLDYVQREGRGRNADEVSGLLREAILEKLRRVEVAGERTTRGSLHIVLVLGVNGSGKTTTIGKLAARHAAAGRKVLLGAGDTFRAAATEQLQAWGERVGCEVIAGQAGGDPSAVAFDTVKAAVARGVDVAIIDTAGRLQTKKPLMEELGKLARVIGREVEGAPHETLLVLDANTGQNAISQARLFTEVAPVSGLVLTKLDGTARGGVIVGLADEFGIPVSHVGVGEGIEDLRDFSAEEFVDALFAD